LEGQRVGEVTISKKVINFEDDELENGHHYFEEKNRVTPSVTAPADTKVSNATVQC